MILFVLHQVFQKLLHWNIAFLDSYIDPFAFAVFALYALKIERKIIWKSTDYTLQVYEIIVAVIALALISEEVFPKFSTDFTKDIYDYLAFGLGGVYFFIFLNSTPSKSHQLFRST